jgi:hypothetical protein
MLTGLAQLVRYSCTQFPNQRGTGLWRKRIDMNDRQVAKAPMMSAILTDIHFWVPTLALACGILLLMAMN